MESVRPETACPEAWRPGALTEQVYQQLRRVAAVYFRHEREAHTLQPTALVHEAYMRLAGSDVVSWKTEQEFCALAAAAMRNILIDHARRRGRQKRGGGWKKVQLDRMEAHELPDPVLEIDLLALDEALTRLAEFDALKARLVELRFFAGLSLEDTARVLDLPRSTAYDHWSMARAWLHRLLDDAHDED